MADTKVAMLSSVLLSSTAGAGAGVGEVSLGRAVVISGTSGADVVVFSASAEGAVTLTGGRAVLAVLG